MGFRAEPVELSRTEVRRVAGAIERLHHGHATLADAAEAIGLKADALARISRQPAAIEVPRVVLVKVAAALQGTVEQLVAGQLAPMAEPRATKHAVRGRGR